MNIEIFTGVGTDFHRLHVINFHAPCCGRKLQIPVDNIMSPLAQKIEEHYQARCRVLEAENKRLCEVIEMGGYINLIKKVAEWV